MSQLRLEHLTLARAERQVLSDVSCVVRPGRVLAVIGPNGSGKSSLVMAACGVLPPLSGTVMVDARDLASLSPQERAQAVAYVPQRTDLLAPLAVSEVVAMGRFAHPDGGLFGRRSSRTVEAISQALALVDASALAERRFTELSGGEMQRVLVARAIATGAPTVLMDEPTSALDVAHRLMLLTLIRRLADDGKGVLVAMHDLHEASQLADEVLLLHQGRVLAHGSAAEVIAAGPIRAAYGVDLIAHGGFGYALSASTPAG